MNAHYRLYIKSIFKLAATLLIKSARTAASMNTKLVAMGFKVDRDDPYSWKYYQNLAGIYHVSDTPMRIMSLDTQEEITFDIPTLSEHLGTRKEYAYGSVYYKELLAAYPDQHMLIRGVLNPVDIGVAVASPDHKILAWDKDEVEAAEAYLIPRVQTHIDQYFLHHNNEDYSLFEPYYYPGLMGGLYTKLPLWIMVLRKEMQRTIWVHSFFIRQYLLSFSPVGKEFDYMPQKLRLWLYRNIRYLNLNLGREEILRLTTDRVLTDQGFNLSGFKFSHVYDEVLKTLKPRIELQQETLNGIEPANGATDKSVGEILDMEVPIAPGNLVYRLDHEPEVIQRSTHAKTSTHLTKVLDSNVLDRADADPFTLSDVLLNHWLYLAHFGRYNTVLTVVNPGNGDTFKLSAKNAFIFYLYAYNKSIDITLTDVPTISANRVRRMPLPTFAELRKLATVKRVPDYAIRHLLADQVPITRYVAVESFRNMCIDVHRKMIEHRKFRTLYQDYKAEGELHTVVDRFYQDIRIPLGPNKTYESWLEEVGIDTSAMGNLEYRLMAKDILTAITGADIANVHSMREIHAAMLRIMRNLSSYSVQFIQTINDSPIKILDAKFPKLTIPKLQEYGHVQIDVEAPGILGLKTRSHVRSKVLVHVPIKYTSSAQSARQRIPVSVLIKPISFSTTWKTLDLLAPSVTLLPQPVTNLSGTRALTLDHYEPQRLEYADLFIGAGFPVMSGGYDTLTEPRRKALFGL